jgi:Zn-dependent protease
MRTGMSQFYELDSTRVSHREFWWGAKSPLVIIGWLTKWLRIRLPGSSDDPNTDSTLPFVVESLPPEIAASFEPLTLELMSLGFSDPVYHVIFDPGTRTTIYWATFLHESGKCFARIHRRLWSQTPKLSRSVWPMFFTAFTDGTFLVSSAVKPDLAAPATVQMNRMHRAATDRLWEAHQRLADQAGARKMVAPVKSRGDLVAMTEQLHVQLRDFHLARGVFRPRTAEEQAKADAFASSMAQAQAGGLEHAEILAEMQKLQEQKSGWAATGWILVISLVLFLALGAARWNWRFTLLIIPVLLFHESGHWAAMQIFGYRNLRMFFIPLFGAAVMGRNWNVPGWKKAIVSLAGPLPGIALGIFLGVAGMVSGKPLLNEAAFLLVIINGLNLLPVLPLDGGHVLHTLLFCRNRWLDVVFRILTIGSLLLLSVAGLGKVFMYLAIFMAIALPVAFKLAKMVDTLRPANLPQPLPGQDQIPVPTAQAIIAEVKAAFPRGVSNKAMAQHALSVFETLNAKPPGALATIGLMTVHGGAFFLTLVFGMLLIINKFGGLGDFAKAAIRQPEHAFKCGSVQRWQGADVRRDLSAPHNLLVATFSRQDRAAAEFTQLTGQLPSGGRLTLFGSSLLLALPAGDDDAREQWFDQLQDATTNVFVAVSNRPVLVNLNFIAPTAALATNLMRELEDFLEAGPGLHLIPPWSLEARKPEFAAALRARHEWKRINAELMKAVRDPSLAANNKKIIAASRRGAMTEVERLEAEQQRLVQELQAKAREQLRAAATNPVVPVLIDLNARLSQLNYSTNRAERLVLLRKIAAHLGEVKYDGDQPAPGADADGAGYGMVSQHGLMIEMAWVRLNDATIGLPALSDWLCNQGCAGITYDLMNSYGGRAEEMDPED